MTAVEEVVECAERTCWRGGFVVVVLVLVVVVVVVVAAEAACVSDPAVSGQFRAEAEDEEEGKEDGEG